MTERQQFIALVWDEAQRALRTVARGDLRERIGRPVEMGALSAADPLSRVYALQLYEGVLKVLPLNGERGISERAFNVLLGEGRPLGLGLGYRAGVNVKG